VSEQQENHTGIVCPFCAINGVCGHPVKLPPLPPWQADVFVKGP
jgi:hypothetical protein